MKIDSDILMHLTTVCSEKMETYVRDKKNFDKKKVEDLVHQLYALEGQKINKIEWLSDGNRVDEKVMTLSSLSRETFSIKQNFSVKKLLTGLR